MTTYLLLGLFVIGIAGATIMYFQIYRSKKTDSDIETFYSIVDNIREYVHSAESRALLREAMDDTINLEADFSGKISKVILDKEIHLLRSVISKKMKKVR